MAAARLFALRVFALRGRRPPSRVSRRISDNGRDRPWRDRSGSEAFLCAGIVAVWALNGGESAADSLRLVTDTYPGAFRDDDKAPGPDIETLSQVFAAMGQNGSFEFFPPNVDFR